MHPLSDRRPCDQCVFMADTFHSDMCLHPARRDPGAVGEALDQALHWNGRCPVQQVGSPAFGVLVALDLPVDEWEAAGEYLRARLAKHLADNPTVTDADMARFVHTYEDAMALVA